MSNHLIPHIDQRIAPHGSGAVADALMALPAGSLHHDLMARLLLAARTDRHALAALAAYAISCADEAPDRAHVVREAVIARILERLHLVTVPATVVGGELVPSFRVGQYLCGMSAFGTIQIDPWSVPWTAICYRAAQRACAACGLALLTERQALAIACNILRQPVNWTGGKIGRGHLYRGLHRGLGEGPRAGNHRSTCPAERRWHVLSTGQMIFDMAGNAYSWIFDDVQGDANGVVAAAFAAGSPSIHRGDESAVTQDAGPAPGADDDYRGEALIRGGHWCSGETAGVFHLRSEDVDHADLDIGFRAAMPQ